MLFKGSIPAIITPFSRSYEIDYDCLEKHIEYLIQGSSHGLVSCGTTGESPTLSHDEHMRVTEFIIKKSDGRVPIMAGCGSNSTEESIDFVGAHYTLNTRSEPFWCKARDQLKKSKRQIFYSEMIKNPSHYTKNNYVSYSFFKKNNWFTWLKQQ